MSFAANHLKVIERDYHDELCAAMIWLSKKPDVVFLGQGVGNPGTSMSKSLEGVPQFKRFEMPVAEEMQVGMCIGMSLKRFVPVCMIPRWNFALRAADQIINHLDRLPLYSSYKPKVIIRIAAPSTFPFNPGPQHSDDFTAAFKMMLKTVQVVTLNSSHEIVPAYEEAYKSASSTIFVEYTDHYRNARAEK